MIEWISSLDAFTVFGMAVGLFAGVVGIVTLILTAIEFLGLLRRKASAPEARVTIRDTSGRVIAEGFGVVERQSAGTQVTLRQA
jgi:hypothetical protein